MYHVLHIVGGGGGVTYMGIAVALITVACNFILVPSTVSVLHVIGVSLQTLFSKLAQHCPYHHDMWYYIRPLEFVFLFA